MRISKFGYFWLDTWVLANIIQLSTQEFCQRYLNRSNDPCGRQYDQMTQAARSVPANIAEGNSRHSTSKETEMKLTDVARASLAELANDVQHLSCVHILQQKRKFDTWLRSKNSMIEANCLLILCNRLILMLGKQITNQLSTFREEGGFTEGLTAERLAYRTEKSINADAPLCPKCGKPMIKRVAKKGVNSGKEFWSCSTYPNCNGTKKIE